MDYLPRGRYGRMFEGMPDWMLRETVFGHAYIDRCDTDRYVRMLPVPLADVGEVQEFIETTWGFMQWAPRIRSTPKEAFIYCEHPETKQRDKMLTHCKLRFG